MNKTSAYLFKNFGHVENLEVQIHHRHVVRMELAKRITLYSRLLDLYSLRC